MPEICLGLFSLNVGRHYSPPYLVVDHEAQSVRDITLVGHVLITEHPSEVDFSPFKHCSRSREQLEVGQGDFDEGIVIVPSVTPKGALICHTDGMNDSLLIFRN